MLSGAIEKLDKLLATLDQRANVQVGGSKPKDAPPPPFETEDEVVIDMRTRQSTLEPQPRAQASMSPSPSQRASDSTRASGSLSSRSELCLVCVRWAFHIHERFTAVDGQRIPRQQRIVEPRHRLCRCPLAILSAGFPLNGL